MAVIAKYKFNSTLYADLVPEFNAEFTNYVVTDETTETDSEGNVIKTRIIEHDTLLPALMRFGILSNPGVRESALTEIISINTSNINDMTCMFYGCTNVTSINTSDWDTSKVTSMNSLFCLCTSLTSIDVSNFDTSNVTDMQYMFSMYSATSKLTTIIGLDKLNTSNVKYMDCMFYLSTNLTSLDVSNFDTKNVTNMSWMFCECNNLTSLDLSNFNTDNVTDMNSMFANCTNLTQLDVSNFNTSNVDNMNSMFANCTNLTQLDVSNWDTSNVTSIYSIFFNCIKLINLNLSDWNTTSFTNLESMFNGCQSLQNLDISNFKLTSSINIKNLFYNISSGIKNIGMLYCDKDTVNLISSTLNTTTNRTIWVKGSIIDDLTSYDNVTYKAYYWEKEVLLNSPLLEGDKIVKKDGKIYHYHKMGKVVLDGSEDWAVPEDSCTLANTNLFRTRKFLDYKAVESSELTNMKSDLFRTEKSLNAWNKQDSESISTGSKSGYLGIDIRIESRKLTSNDPTGFKQWLSNNPTTVVYELANPYYELISDTSDDLSLSLLSEDNIISNNSLIPTNMNIKNNGMTTVAMQSSTKYTVAFDKDTDSSVTIDLCGSTIETTDNVVEITTPSELTNDEITFIGDCEVSNVRILEGSVSGDAIPKESFEGLKSSFEDGRLPESMITQSEVQFSGLSLQEDWYFTDNSTSIDYTGVKILKDYKDRLEIGKTYTFMLTVTNTYTSDITFKDGYDIRGVGAWYDVATLHAGETKTIVLARNYNTNIEVYNVFNFGATQSGVSYKVNKNIIVLEGDWTHLTEEDWNNLGKYKVEYKVTGKNKATLQEEGAYYNYTSGYKMSSTTHNSYIALVEPSKTYIVSFENTDRGKISNLCFWDSSMKFINGLAFNEDDLTFTTPYNAKFIAIAVGKQATAFQIEEGTVATEYEPYKEYTRTFYLNSPLLEGDTIEDVNGVATHVHRYGKVVLDGSTDVMQVGSKFSDSTCFIVMKPVPHYAGKPSSISPTICDRLASKSVYSYNVEGIYDNNANVCVRLNNYRLKSIDTSGIKQWLSENPLTVAYELMSPVYETISEDSILCDSYVNGHLDFDSAVPVEKVMFRYVPIENAYLIPNTNYVIQFESDNVGKLDSIVLGGYSQLHNIDVVKGLNRIKLSTVDDVGLGYTDLYGIGFNASNVQVVATDRDNIGYFKGIQSSFEDKIRSKNLFNKDNIVLNYGFNTDGSIINPSSIEHSTEYIECKPNTSYTCNFGTGIHYFDENKTWISYQNHGTSSPSNAKYLVKCIGQTVDLNTVQIEEGKNITTYEPYGNKYEVKVTLEDENGVISNEFIYLNSPLLKGDRIEMYNGKLCHYHKMGSIVLDGGNEYWEIASNYSNCIRLKTIVQNCNGGLQATKPISDRFIGGLSGEDIENIDNHNERDILQITISKSRLSTTDVDEFKQWLQANPTTVVYELKEPYYEDITPIQNEFVITSIGESSFTIDSGVIPTDGEITYSVNVKLLNDLEESINNNTSSTDTDLSTILDDIINE